MRRASCRERTLRPIQPDMGNAWPRFPALENRDRRRIERVVNERPNGPIVPRRLSAKQTREGDLRFELAERPAVWQIDSA